MKTFGCCIALFASLVADVANSQDNGASVLDGKRLSEQHCSRCHVVDPAKPFTGISSTPSFKLMVNELADWEDRFLSFYARLPHPSIVRLDGEEGDENAEDLQPPVEIAIDDVDAILAYASTLKQ